MCDRVVSEYPFILIYCLDRYKTQKMCDEAIDDCLAALKFILDWFVTSKILEELRDVLLTNDDLLFFDKDFSKVTFFAKKIGTLNVDLENINLDDDNNFDEDHPETDELYMSDLWFGVIDLKNVKHVKKIKVKI